MLKSYNQRNKIGWKEHFDKNLDKPHEVDYWHVASGNLSKIMSIGPCSKILELLINQFIIVQESEIKEALRFVDHFAQSAVGSPT